MKIKKGIKLHIAPKPYEWFEVWDEREAEVQNDQEVISLFQKTKASCISDAKDMLKELNLPALEDNLLSLIIVDIPQRVVQQQQFQYNIISPVGQVSVSEIKGNLPQNNVYKQEEKDVALGIESQLDISKFSSNTIPEIK